MSVTSTPSLEAPAALMERCAGPTYRLAFFITRNHADAEEIVQRETLERALDALPAQA